MNGFTRKFAPNAARALLLATNRSTAQRRVRVNPKKVSGGSRASADGAKRSLCQAGRTQNAALAVALMISEIANEDFAAIKTQTGAAGARLTDGRAISVFTFQAVASIWNIGLLWLKNSEGIYFPAKTFTILMVSVMTTAQRILSCGARSSHQVSAATNKSTALLALANYYHLSLRLG